MAKGNKLEKHKMVCLNTGHVSEATAKWLTAQARETGQIALVVYEKGEYGWFVPVCEKEIAGYLGLEIPTDMLHVLSWAIKKEIDWIMFDSDGPTVEKLDRFDW